MEDSESENRLAFALQNEGLSFISQYKISDMHVDFADPRHKVVIEVDGIHHETRHQRKVDKGRDYILRKRGWRVKRVSAEQAYYHPADAAKEIREFISHRSIFRNIVDLLSKLFILFVIWNIAALFNLWIPALIVLAIAVVAWKKGYLQ